MLQWMGGARRKMKAAKDSKLKRQREFFDHRKEKKRRNDLEGESGKLRTLADYIRQNLHGDESLDILGLRRLNPTPADANTAADSDSNLPDPAIASLKSESGDTGGATVATSNVSASSVDALKGNDQETPSQPECNIKSRRIIQEQKQERAACSQQKPGVANAAQQENKKLVNRNIELSLRGRGRNPVNVGNLQTKKVAAVPRMIANDKCIFDQHPQETFNTSDRKVADWGDTEQLLASSLQPTNTSDCHPEIQITGTSDLLSRFLSTQKLKSFKEISSHHYGRRPQEHSMSAKDSAFELASLVKEEPRGINFPSAMFDMENFHVKQEPEEFDISDPFETIAVEEEHEDLGLSDPFIITKNHQEERERQEYELMSPTFDTGEHRVTQGCPFKVDENSFEWTKGFRSPGSNPVNWDSDSQLNTSSTPSYFKSWIKREFLGLDHFKSLPVPSYDGSLNNGFHQFGTYANIPDMTENFYPHLEIRETADVKFDKLLLPLDGYEVDGQHSAAAFSSLDDYSPRRMTINRSIFDNEPPDWDDVLCKRCSYPDNSNCEPSEAWDASRCQESNDPAHSGRNSRNHNDDNSWSQTTAGGTAGYFTDHLTGDINAMHGTSPRHCVMPGKDLSSDMQAIIEPEILQDSKLPFLPQIKNEKEDFIIVCFSDNEDSSNVGAKTMHLPIQSNNIPPQLLGTVESSSKTEHGINGLSPGIPLNRVTEEIDDSRIICGNAVTTVKTTNTTDKLILGREDSSCDTILTSHQSRKDYLSLLNSVCSHKKDTELRSWQAIVPQREAYPELQSSKARRSSPKLLALESGKFEDGSEHHSCNSEKGDQCFSSNVLRNHCDDLALQHKMVHNVDENSLEACTPFEKVLQENVNEVSTTKGKDTPQKQLRSGNAHDNGCQASFSSQEEFSPAIQLNAVQAVLCKLRRPVCSYGSKQDKLSGDEIKNVDTVLLKLQRPTSPSSHGLGHQDTERNQSLHKKIKLTSDKNRKSDLDLETKPTAECQPRSLTHLNISGSRGSLPLSCGVTADRFCMERPASKPISRSSDEDAQKRGSSNIKKQRYKEARMSLDDIDAITSSSHRVSIQSYRRRDESKEHSLHSEVEIKNVLKSSVPAGGSIQRSISAFPRNQISVVPEEEQPSTRISDLSAGGAQHDRTPVSERNPSLIVAAKEQPHLADSDLPAYHTGALEIPSNAPEVSERPKVSEVSQDHGLNDTRHNLPNFENFAQSGGSTTSYDAAYVKMLESYVVQLKLENNALRLSNGS